MEAATQEQQVTAPEVNPAAPAVQSEETSAQPEQQAGQEGTEKKVETEETPQRRESRRQRQLNRERERRIAAETELRLLREQQQGRQEQRPVVSDEPKREQFESYESFIEARATWRAEKAAEEKTRKILDEARKQDETKRAQGQQKEVASKFDSHYQKAAEGIEDFDDVMGDEDSVELLSKVFGTDKPLSVQAIHEAEEKGPLILYYLAKNPAEVERISKLSPARQAAAIVALEEKVSKPAKQPSKAPAPISPVGTKGSAGKDPSKMTQAEYNEWRNQGGK